MIRDINWLSVVVVARVESYGLLVLRVSIIHTRLFPRNVSAFEVAELEASLFFFDTMERRQNGEGARESFAVLSAKTDVEHL